MTPDVNLLVAASRADHPHHRVALDWIEARGEHAAGGASWVLLPMVVAGFLRLVTHPKVFPVPTPPATAADFITALIERGWRPARIGDEVPHLVQLCAKDELSGNAVPDAWIAAAVIAGREHLVTFDRDFRKLLPRNRLTVLKPA